MKLRLKILSGFFIIVLMLFLAGIWSINELSSMSGSVDKILEDNYKSINAGNTMVEALEREDSGILLLLLGHWKLGRKILTSGDSLFYTGFNIANKNITIPGEREYLDSIKTTYANYKDLWETPIVDTEREGNLNWYSEKIHISFNETKTLVNKLMSLNNANMYQSAIVVKSRTNRVIMPGIIAMLAAVLFTLIFNFMINFYIVKPIVNMTNNTREFIENRTPYEVEIESRDELSDLNTAIRTICSLASSQERSL
jgi:HAMP domain-containing protein